jgi:hypothetical protein
VLLDKLTGNQMDKDELDKMQAQHKEEKEERIVVVES